MKKITYLCRVKFNCMQSKTIYDFTVKAADGRDEAD